MKTLPQSISNCWHRTRCRLSPIWLIQPWIPRRPSSKPKTPQHRAAIWNLTSICPSTIRLTHRSLLITTKQRKRSPTTPRKLKKHRQLLYQHRPPTPLGKTWSHTDLWRLTWPIWNRSSPLVGNWIIRRGAHRSRRVTRTSKRLSTKMAVNSLAYSSTWKQLMKNSLHQC